MSQVNGLNYILLVAGLYLEDVKDGVIDNTSNLYIVGFVFVI